MSTQEVILVNDRDEPTGLMEKMEAHQKGLLHRAFSIFIFDSRGRMLLQQRSAEKYHGAHLWTNACCSHPYPGESTEDAAKRRLTEELGFHTPIHKIFAFTYRAAVENGLIEHEYDHVFTGKYEGEIRPDIHEVADYKYQDMEKLRQEINEHPELFTTWFKIAFPSIDVWWRDHYGKMD